MTEISDATLERAVTLAAWIVTRHGPVYAPIFDRLAAELEERRRRADPVARARRYLEAGALAGEKNDGAKMIAVGNRR